MKPVVVHFTSCAGKTTLASAGIARFLSRELKCPLIDSFKSVDGMGLFDTVFVVNSPWAFCDFRDQADRLTEKKHLIFCQNDYAIDIPKHFKNYDRLFSTCRQDNEKLTYINWNQLTYQSKPHVGGMGLIYYGAYREDREEKFRKYFPELGQRLVISGSSAKALDKFRRLNRFCKFAKPIHDLPNILPKFDATLYLQDARSGQAYHSPANRLYEALAAGLAIFFEPDAVEPFKTAGYDVTPYVVSDSLELSRRLGEHRAIASAQHKAWARDYIGDLRKSLKKALKGLL